MIRPEINGPRSFTRTLTDFPLDELVTFTKDLNDEEQRHLREQISEEELAVFDILTRPGPDLTPVETEAIKKVCKDLLAKLKTEKLVLAWRTKRTTRAAVRVEIEKMLDSGLQRNIRPIFLKPSVVRCFCTCWGSIPIRERVFTARPAECLAFFDDFSEQELRQSLDPERNG